MARIGLERRREEKRIAEDRERRAKERGKAMEDEYQKVEAAKKLEKKMNDEKKKVENDEMMSRTQQLAEERALKKERESRRRGQDDEEMEHSILQERESRRRSTEKKGPPRIDTSRVGKGKYGQLGKTQPPEVTHLEDSQYLSSGEPLHSEGRASKQGQQGGAGISPQSFNDPSNLSPFNRKQPPKTNDPSAHLSPFNRKPPKTPMEMRHARMIFPDRYKETTERIKKETKKEEEKKRVVSKKEGSRSDPYDNPIMRHTQELLGSTLEDLSGIANSSSERSERRRESPSPQRRKDSAKHEQERLPSISPSKGHGDIELSEPETEEARMRRKAKEQAKEERRERKKREADDGSLPSLIDTSSPVPL